MDIYGNWRNSDINDIVRTLDKTDEYDKFVIWTMFGQECQTPMFVDYLRESDIPGDMRKPYIVAESDIPRRSRNGDDSVEQDIPEISGAIVLIPLDMVETYANWLQREHPDLYDEWRTMAEWSETDIYDQLRKETGIDPDSDI